MNRRERILKLIKELESMDITCNDVTGYLDELESALILDSSDYIAWECAFIENRLDQPIRTPICIDKDLDKRLSVYKPKNKVEKVCLDKLKQYKRKMDQITKEIIKYKKELLRKDKLKKKWEILRLNKTERAISNRIEKAIVDCNEAELKKQAIRLMKLLLADKTSLITIECLASRYMTIPFHLGRKENFQFNDKNLENIYCQLSALEQYDLPEAKKIVRNLLKSLGVKK